MEAEVGAPPFDAIDSRAVELLDKVSSVAEGRGRGDLAKRLREERARADSAVTTLVVAGETKRGKSSLVNALLGYRDLSPVDADVATNAYIVIRHASPPVTRVYRVDGPEDGEVVSQDSVAAWASESENPENKAGVRAVEIGLDHPLLAQGLQIIDTPGVGGLNAAHGRVTLAALETADALLFVLDTTAPITRPELDFLGRVTGRIGTVLFALTKTRNPGWETILADDRTEIAEHAPRFAVYPFFPVDSEVKLEADAIAAEGDAEFASAVRAESGFDALEREITTSLVGRARALRVRNALQLAKTMIAELEQPERDAIAAAVADPRLAVTAAEATRHLHEFSQSKRIGGIAVGEEFARLGETVMLELNRLIAGLARSYDAAIEAGDVNGSALAEDLEADITTVVARLNSLLDDGIADVVTRVDRELDITIRGEKADLEAEDVQRSPAQGPVRAETLGKSAMRLLPTLVGAAMPKMMLGTFAPGLAAALGPLTIVAGIGWVALNVIRQKKLLAQQEARKAVRDTIEDVRRELPPLMSRTLREARKALERELQAAMAQRERELGEAVRKQKELARADTTTKQRAKASAESRLQELDALRQQVEELERELAGSPEV